MFEPSAPGSRRDAFETIALVHFDTVYKVAMALTRNRDEAQDLVQETYGKAYRFWHRFQPGTHVKAWLLTILRHTHISAYRKASRQRIHTTVGAGRDRLRSFDPERDALNESHRRSASTGRIT